MFSRASDVTIDLSARALGEGGTIHGSRPRQRKRQPFTSDSVLNSIFTIFALLPSSSLIQLPMSAASSALPRGEIQLTGSRSKLSSSTPTIVNVSVAPFLSFNVTVAPNATLLDGASGGSTTWTVPEFVRVQ